MERDTRQLSYYLLQSRSCEDCSSDIDFQSFNVNLTDESDFAGDYQCPNCNSQFEFFIDFSDSRAKIEVVNESGERANTTITPLAKIRQSQSNVSDLIKEIYTLKDVFDILDKNYQRMTNLEDRFPDLIEQGTGRSIQDWQAISPTKDLTFDFEQAGDSQPFHIEIHNYLSSAYTFDQVIETIRPKVEWGDEVVEQFDRYSTQKKVVMGLRHYIQHESAFSLQFQVNQGESEREIDILTNVKEVEKMDSQVPIHPPDGYKAENGSDSHYGDIDGQKVNISDHMAKYHLQTIRLSLSIMEGCYETHKEEIEDFERHHEDFPSFEDLESIQEDIDLETSQ